MHAPIKRSGDSCKYPTPKCSSLWEKAHHFGMICNCEAHVKMGVEDRKRHVPCWRNGRRMAEADDFAKKKAAKMLLRSRQITTEECEQDDGLRQTISFLLNKRTSC